MTETKPRATLVPRGVMAAVVRVLTKGAVKHGDFGWHDVPRDDHYDAMERHREAWLMGEDVDPDSGESHLAHLISRAMFLWWLDDQADSAGITEEFVAEHAPLLARMREAIEAARRNPAEPVSLQVDYSVPATVQEWRCHPVLVDAPPCPSATWQVGPAPFACAHCGSPLIAVRVNGKEL